LRGLARPQLLQYFLRLRPLGVVFAGGGIENRAIAFDDERSRDGQFPTVIAIGKGKVDESASVNVLLIVWYAIDESTLSCNRISGIAEQREPQLVLVRHEEGLLNRLRRNRDEIAGQ